MLNMEFQDRLKARMREIGVTATELASRLSLSKGTITHWTQGTNKAGGTNLINLAKVLACDPDWLLTGRGTLPLDINTEKALDMRGLLPILSWVAAGHWQDIRQELAVEEWIACPIPHSSKAFALRVRGESMYNPQGNHSFKEGDLIYVDPDRMANNGSFVVARLEGTDETTFKQLVIEDNRYFLKALNPSWPTRIVEIGEEVDICGVVIGRLDVL